MQILTYGTSGMDTLPHDPSMLDQANLEYSYDPSTSHEKEDIDNITVPLARNRCASPRHRSKTKLRLRLTSVQTSIRDRVQAHLSHFWQKAITLQVM